MFLFCNKHVKKKDQGKAVKVLLDASWVKAENDGYCFFIFKKKHSIRAEEELENFRERHELIIQGLSVGVWDWNVVTDTEYLTDRFKEILGIRDPDFKPTLNFVYDMRRSIISGYMHMVRQNRMIVDDL